MNDNSPTPDFDLPPPVPSPRIDNTASLSQRFWAFVIDALCMGVALIVIMQSMGLLDPASTNDLQVAQRELQARVDALTDSQKSFLAISPLMAFFLLHGFLLQQYGQTIGKRIIGIAIVTLDNQKPAFLPLIVQRYISQWLMGMVPVLGMLLRLADILFIFRDDHRCIHDHIAKTKVIDVKISVNQGALSSQGKPSSIIV